MKKLAVILLCVLMLVSGGVVYAAGGTQSDPLVSLSYLTGTYISQVLEQAQSAINTKTDSAYQQALGELNAAYEAAGGAAGESGSVQNGLADQRFKRGDVITLSTGSGVMLLAGSATAGVSAGGALVDTTAGQALSTGAALSARHRCLAAENTTAAVTVTSDTAVISLEGRYTVSPSDQTDYNALAGALAQLGMFKGTGTAYGSGYDLEVAPTRIVGLVMFLRLLGEEQAALASTAENPFADTPDWCDRYVAYAYAQGYTKGVGAGAGGTLYFGPNSSLSANEYLTFVLRALGYTDGGESPDFTWETAVETGCDLGVLTQGEGELLSSGNFLRAQVAYVSCFALQAPMKQGGTLLEHLSAAGVLDKAAAQQVLAEILPERIN